MSRLSLHGEHPCENDCGRKVSANKRFCLVCLGALSSKLEAEISEKLVTGLVAELHPADLSLAATPPYYPEDLAVAA